jgi:riboflavin kinase/FMN adenylyltransferase
MVLKLIRGIANMPDPFPGCVATMGNFDGIHIGHQQLIQQLLQHAQRWRLPSVVITFEPQPNEFFSSHYPHQKPIPPRLMRLREKMRVLEQLGVDYVLCLTFDEQLATLSAVDFIKTIFVEQLKLAHICVGDDLHFGYKREGDIKLLKKLASSHQFSVDQIPTFYLAAERVSSTWVRMALEAGDLATAHRLLGRNFGLSGRVAHGHKRGRMIGFPTANLFLHGKAVPLHGVFAVKTYGLGIQPILGVANIGNRPTVDGTRSLLEVHLFDFDQDIYGQHIYVEFMHKIREEKKFDSFEFLKEQILKDAQEARGYFYATLPLLPFR